MTRQSDPDTRRPPADSRGTTLRVVCGPTAAGKSRIAEALAAANGLAIVSADSRQVYRGFDIGTAKPPRGVAVRYFGVDVAEPTERYSAARWADAAAGWVAEARAEGLEPIVVGGTGFYLRALFDPLFEEPELDPERRAPLQRLLDELPSDELRRWCLALDPARAGLGRTQLLRAVEVALLTGRRLSELHSERQRPARFSARYLVVDPGPSLAGRIEQRVWQMLDAGWEDEVRGLNRSVPEDAPAWNATGYRHVRALVRGELAREEAVRRTVIDTRQYAKRQRTWFRHQLPEARVTRLDPCDPGADRIAGAWWRGEMTA
ncbi:MAG TPA: tRNA (adenosine(37)-N6)-dimethylallyltransferase MiaA [Gemmatimonadaceae bacterium]|nr:tRNA (adenosine(37)-N6)-dimethylallyltransferase MiaA [Gemmatimonadaceae bacterium]